MDYLYTGTNYIKVTRHVCAELPVKAGRMLPGQPLKRMLTLDHLHDFRHIIYLLFNLFCSICKQ